MAQTTGAMSPQNMYLGFSTDGSTWTEVTGSGNSVSKSGGERESGSARTFGYTAPIVKYGGKAPLRYTIRGVYSEKAAEAYLLAQAAYDNDTDFYFRYSPGGGDSGDLGFTASAGKVMNPPYPDGSADTPDPILIEFDVEFASLTQAAIGTAGW